MSEQETLTVSKAEHDDFLWFGEGRCYVVESEDEHVAFCYSRKRADQLVRTGNAHKDLLAACEISEICFRKLADIGTLGTSKHVLLDNANMIKSVIAKANKEN